MTKKSCGCDVGPGKFEGEGAITFLAYEMVMNGGSDTTTGGDEAVDWIRAPLNFQVDKECTAAALRYGYCERCIRTAGDGIEGGVAVWEDSQGIVYSRVFETKEEFDQALAEAEGEDEDEE